MLSKIWKTREVGFTLIEILTVIIIIGVLAAIAIPVFSAQRSRAQDSQTVSDVRNIVTATETLLSDRTKSVSDLSQASLEYASSNNVLWNISGNTTTGGYCIAAFNASGKDYKTTSTLLTYDSTAGGLKKVGGSCGTVVGGAAGANGSVTPTPTSSTGVGSDTVRNAVAPTSAGATRAGNNGSITWTASTDSNVTGYAIQRSDAANGTFATVGTASGKATVTYTDTTAVAANTYYYRVASMVGSGTSTLVSNVATLSPAFTSITYNYTGAAQSFTVPSTGTYTVETYGAAGGQTGNAAGYGAWVKANYTLTAGTTYVVIVGGQGLVTGHGGGGGGGTFVYVNGASQPLQVSGGGGGSNPMYGYYGTNASTDLNNPGSGNGGAASRQPGGGAGWNGNGGNGSYSGYGPGGGQSRDSWAGGIDNHRRTFYSAPYSDGGYGGGGAGAAGGGGGGGYTGGYTDYADYARGGTSYMASGGSLISASAISTGNGQVTISKL